MSNTAEVIIDGSLSGQPMIDIIPNIDLGIDSDTSIFDTPISSNHKLLTPQKTVTHIAKFNPTTKTEESVDLKFYCIIDTINTELQTLEATAYNEKTRETEMSLNLEFSDFSEGDLALLAEGAIFYWKIGSKLTTSFSKTKARMQSKRTNFSEYKMKRTYVRPDSVCQRIKKQMEVIDFVLG